MNASKITTVTLASTLTMTASQANTLLSKISGSIRVDDAMGAISGYLTTFYASSKVASISVASGTPTAQDVTNLVASKSKITSIAVSSVTMSVSQYGELSSKITGPVVVSDTLATLNNSLLDQYSTVSNLTVKIGETTAETGADVQTRIANLLTYDSIITSIKLSSAVTLSVLEAGFLDDDIASNGKIIVSDTMAAISPNLSAYSTNDRIGSIVITSGVQTTHVPNLVTYASKITSVNVGSGTVYMSVEQATTLLPKIIGTIVVSDTMDAISSNLDIANVKIARVEITSGVLATHIPYLDTHASKITVITLASTLIMTASQANTLLSKISGSIRVNDAMGAMSGYLTTFGASTKVVSISVTSGSPTAQDVANLVTYAEKIVIVNAFNVEMSAQQAAVLQSKFFPGSIIITDYTLSGDPTNGSPYLVTSGFFAASLVDSSDGVVGNKQFVIDFTASTKTNTFTQSANTIELDANFDVSRVNEVKFISLTNTVVTRASPANASSIQDTSLALFPVVWGGTQYTFQPISAFLEVLFGDEITQREAEITDLHKSRGSFTVYLQQLNTSVYSEIAAGLVLKPTTENAVATFKVTPAQINNRFAIDDTTKTITLLGGLESVFGKSWLDSFQITYSDLFPSISFPNYGPTDNVITDMQKALFHLIVPTATLLQTNFTSLLADPAATVQAEYNNGMQLRALVTNYFQNNSSAFYAAIQDSYTNTSSFAAFQKGDVIQWKVTMHVPLEGLGAPPGSSSGTSLSQSFSRVYLFQILVDDANFSAFDTAKYGKLVSEDDTAVGIFNTGNSNSATNKRTYPYQYVNLGNNAYVATDKNSTKYGETAFQAASGANVIGDVY
jgi:hypothetical protein